jgi:uncharacterized protein (DUF1501 family)
MTHKIDTSRRRFLQRSVVLSAAGSIGAPFALDLFRMNQAAAITSGLTDYKALVCIYLGGGNDHNNMVLATDSSSWQGYMKARDTRDSNGGGSIALVVPNTFNSNALSISPTTTQVGRTFGLHPAMLPMQTLFNTDKKAAIVANVGPLTEPIASATEYKTKTKPANLFSHSDQTAQWQTSQASPLYGWGGRVAQQVIGNNSKTNFTCISSSGNTLFLAGQGVNQYQVNSNGTATSIQGMTNSTLYGVTVDTNTASSTYGNPLKSIITPTSTNYFEIDHAAVVQRSIDARQNLTDAMAATTGIAAAPTVGTGLDTYLNPLTGLAGETNPLATQLRTVARIISEHTALGANRQIFYVTLGGFDTHDGQANGHAVLMARLAHGMYYFHKKLESLGLSNNVTTFTSSDFGRTFASNGDGTDHGWGAHHFVVGGAVNGGDIYGTFPMTAVTGAARTVNGVSYPAFTNLLDVGSGNLVPQISVDQYAATMAKWFGLSGDAINLDIQTVFPNLYRFTPTLLGFV